MKKSHHALVKKAVDLRKTIKARTLKLADLKADVLEAQEKLRASLSDLSELEAEAADDGLSSSALHEAADKAMV